MKTINRFYSKEKQLPTAATVKFVLRAFIVSLALRSSNSRTATRSFTVLSPSSEYLVISSESRVAWLDDRAETKYGRQNTRTGTVDSTHPYSVSCWCCRFAGTSARSCWGRRRIPGARAALCQLPPARNEVPGPWAAADRPTVFWLCRRSSGRSRRPGRPRPFPVDTDDAEKLRVRRHMIQADTMPLTTKKITNENRLRDRAEAQKTRWNGFKII